MWVHVRKAVLRYWKKKENHREIGEKNWNVNKCNKYRCKEVQNMNTTKEYQPVKIRFRTKKHFQRLTTSVNLNFVNRAQVVTQPPDNKQPVVSVVSPEPTELTEEQKQVLMHWIDENLQIIDTINKKNTVFELIDAFNMTINPDFQVTADQFSSALLESGFRVENWRFNVSGVSIKKLRHIAEKLQKLDNQKNKKSNVVLDCMRVSL